ncbi:hypothetical protein EON64_15430 [archaeon]|nr:MAG: hypothetical protein EON64_15430 [archaeon]
MESNLGLATEAYAIYKFGKALNNKGGSVDDEMLEDKDDSDSSSFNEPDNRTAALNLLGFANKHLQHIDSGDRAGEASRQVEGSVAKHYQPKFLRVYEKYCESLAERHSSPIDLTRHLMAICLEHLMTFSCWARETSGRCMWVKSVLEENADLRPEVRQ